MARIWQRLHKLGIDLIACVPSGRGGRRAVAGFMVIMGLGRLGAFSTFAQSTVLTNAEYGIALVVLGALLYIDGPWRLAVSGRIIAFVGSVFMAGMAWDVGYISVTMLFESWMAIILLKEGFTSHDC